MGKFFVYLVFLIAGAVLVLGGWDRYRTDQRCEVEKVRVFRDEQMAGSKLQNSASRLEAACKTQAAKMAW